MSLPFMTLALCTLTQLLSIYCILLVLLRQSNSTATMVVGYHHPNTVTMVF